MFGAVLICVGVLIAGLCGTCSLAALLIMGPNAGSMLTVAIIGGIPVAAGVGIVMLGLKLRRPRT